MLNTQKTGLDTLILQNQGNIVSDMDGEKVMMSIEKGKYYNLGVVGGVIWDAIKSPISINDLISYLITEFDVDYNKCREQVLSFLLRLNKEGLVEFRKAANVQG
jgi:hypothetical protein